MGPVGIRRAADPPRPEDGMRVLVDRRWPPGLSKEQVAADLWLPDAAPSDALRRWGLDDPRRHEEFKARYREELAPRDDILYLLDEMARRGPVTLLCGLRDPTRNGAEVLVEMLEEWRAAGKGDEALKAKDIMTTQVIAIEPETRVPEIAALLLERRISGLPVVERGRVVGMVSEGDLLRRYEIGTDRKRYEGSWWMHFFKRDPGPAEYVKSHAGRAADIMTSPVVCISEDLPVAKIAGIFEKRRIKRVPVVQGDRLVGIVSRANLVQALAVKTRTVTGPRAQTDDAIRARLLTELSAQAWWHATSNVIVTDGVVHYWGVYEKADEKEAARVAAENVPGVRRIDDHRSCIAELQSMG
jgi:CBS domain-containing protein